MNARLVVIQPLTQDGLVIMRGYIQQGWAAKQTAVVIRSVPLSKVKLCAIKIWIGNISGWM